MKRIENQDYYQILEVSYKASWGEIQKAYELAKATYSKNAMAPYSLFDFAERGRILDKIEEAYLILNHPEKRVKYDYALAILLSEPASSAPPKQMISPAPQQVLTLPETPSTTPEPITRVPISVQVSLPEEEKTPVPALAPAVVIEKSVQAVATSTTKPSEISAPHLENDVVSGKTLKTMREQKGITLASIADKTLININYLEFIEANKYSSLPASVYIVGYLKQYAKIVGIDGSVMEEYMKTYQRWSDAPKPKERFR